MKNLILAIIIVLAAVSGFELVRELGYQRLETVFIQGHVPAGRIELPTECATLRTAAATYADGVLTVQTGCEMRNKVELASEWKYDSASAEDKSFPLEQVEAIVFTSAGATRRLEYVTR